MKVWLTGAVLGFLGARLARVLRAAGHEVHTPAVDLFDAAAVRHATQAASWDAVIHLAAIASVPRCDANPELAWRTNVGCTGLLLEMLARHAPQAHLLFTSTGHVYAPPRGPEIAEGVVLDEDRAIEPLSTYARTKWAAELLLHDAAQRTGQTVTVLRLFNHTHRSQPTSYFLPHIHATLRATPAGERAVVPVGNLFVERDMGALPDLMGAFLAVLDARAGDEGLAIYNVCSGVGRHLGDLAAALAARLGVDAEFRTDPDRVRDNDPRRVVGSHDRLTAATGWTPSCTTLDALLDAFLDKAWDE
ncbi:MAG: NAD(P)-dependent oxidoreductase [Deltaproteobacteria bacterium]|nr:NAD(P)-dependent oxidoreductase [Deltaproteobacteria bacterium]